MKKERGGGGKKEKKRKDHEKAGCRKVSGKGASRASRVGRR